MSQDATIWNAFGKAAENALGKIIDTLLLDMKERRGRALAGIEHINGWLNVIEPVLWRLEKRRIGDDALGALLGNVFRWRTAVIGGVVTGLSYLGIHVTGLPK